MRSTARVVPAAFGSRLRRGRRHAASLPTTLVVGIASGASAAPPGVLAMHCVQASHGRRTDLRFAQATAPPAVLAADLVAGELIAIGEARLGAAPGRVSMLAGAAADRLLSAPEYATAAPGLLEALAQLEEAGRPPRHRAVLNIEPAPIASRYAPRFMAASVAQAAAQVIALVEAWRLFARITVRAGDDGCLLLRGD